LVFFGSRLLRLFFVICYLVVGIGVSAAYAFFASEREEDRRRAREGLVDEKGVVRMSRETEDRNLDLEYQNLNKNVDERGNQTLLSGTIILAASVLIMLESLRLDANEIGLLPFIILASLSIDHDKPLIETVGATVEEALELLSKVGLNDAFLFLRNYDQLSDGQSY